MRQRGRARSAAGDGTTDGSHGPAVRQLARPDSHGGHERGAEVSEVAMVVVSTVANNGDEHGSELVAMSGMNAAVARERHLERLRVGGVSSVPPRRQRAGSVGSSKDMSGAHSWWVAIQSEVRQGNVTITAEPGGQTALPWRQRLLPVVGELKG